MNPACEPQHCPARRAGLIAALLVVLCGRALAQSSEVASSPRPWSPEVLGALESYRVGELAAAQRLSVEAASQSRDAGVRRDAAVVEALCLLRMPARSDRVDGRARLRQLAAEDPTLLDEPECNLAYGIAQTELSETADALDALDRAATGFAQQGLPARQAEALVAVARAWSRHGEWEATPPRFGVRRPQGPAEADEIRRAQIAALRPRIAALPDHEAALAELDLILAQHFLDAGDPTSEGFQMLVELAAAPRLTRATAAATLLLAEQYESNAQWSEALPLYQRLLQEWHGEEARRAGERAQEITRPQIVADVPGRVPSGQTVRVRLRVRGLDAAQVEVRQVDVDAWLSTPRSRVSAAFLPESGSVRLARNLSTRAAVPYGWWNSDKLESPLEFAGAPGAYVLVVRATESASGGTAVKRLLLVSDLRATCFVGSQHALVWAVPPSTSEGSTAAGEPTAQFWMNRSFVPTEVTLDGGVGRFALPNEARVLRDRGWVCLVRCGEHLAVCRGSLPPAESVQAGPQMALLAGPPSPRVGEALYISGLLWPAPGAPAGPATAPLELRVVDAVGDVQFACAAALTRGGAFTVQMPIAAEQVGKHLRVLARQAGRTLENLLGRVAIRVPPTDAASYRVRIDVPTWLPGDAALLTGCVRVEYPWGTPPARVRVQLVFRAIPLPTDTSLASPTVASVEREGRLDETGQMTFALPLADLGPAGSPLAVSVEANARTWDGRNGVGLAEVLVGPRQPHTWLVCMPTQPLADQEVRFRVGWFDPAGLALDGTPEVTVRRGDQEIARLPLYPSREGWTSEPWRPPEPGAYGASSSLTALGLEPLVVSRTIEVLPASDTRPAPTLHCAAHLAPHGDHAAVEAELKGRCLEPLLVLAADGDPQAARTIRALEGRATVLLPLDAEPAPEMSVAILGEGAAGLEVLRHVPVVRAANQTIDIALATPQREVWPGTDVAVRATCRQAAGLPSGTTLVARLIDAADTGYVQGAPGPQGWRSAEDALRLTIVSSDTGPLTTDNAGRETAESTPAAGDITTVLSEGVTLWSTCLATEGEGTELRVPIPAQPGLYKLVVVARTPAGETASAATILDARRGVRLEVDAPPRLTVGDRSVVAVLVENAGPQPVEVRVQYDPGAGLHLETLRAEDTRALAAPLKTGDPVMLNLPAAGRAWLHLSVEATQVGTGRAWAAVSAGDSRQTASCPYEVRPLDAVASDAVLRIRRTLLVWTPPPDVAGSGSSPKDKEPRWSSAPFLPETRLMPGQFLEVAEELTLREPTPEVDWWQRVPPTCHSAAGQFPQIQSLGPRQPDQPGTLVFKVPALRPGTYTHRYFLAVVRPGVATIPTPELRRGDATVPVVVEPANLQIVVPETE